MKTVDVRINKAKILGFNVKLKEDNMPDIEAAIGLFAGERKMSTFHLSTSYCYGESIKFDIPHSIVQSILSITSDLEYILVREFNRSFKRLEGDVIDCEQC